MDNSRSFVVEYRKRDEPNWDNSNFAFKHWTKV